MTKKLPIETKPVILQEYGRAFAYICHLEGAINTVLSHKHDDFKKLSGQKQLEKFDKMTLGKKIQQAKEFLSEDLIKELWEINNKRILLAHGITADSGDGSIWINCNLEWHDLNEEFLSKTTKLAKALYERIMQEIRSNKK